MTVVLDLGGPDTTRLRVSIAVDPARPPSIHHAEIEVAAHPWLGTLQTSFAGEDLVAWAAELSGTSVPRTITLGGGRAAELVLRVEEVRPARSSVVVTAELVPSGDDPFAFLRFLLWDVPRDFGVDAAEAVRALCE